MANEIKVSAGLQCQNGSFNLQRTQKTFPYNQTGIGRTSDTPSIAITPTAITFPGGFTPGWSYFSNLDPTNYVDLGVMVSSVFYPFLRLLPTEQAAFRLTPGIALYAQANTAPVLLDYDVLEN